MAPLKVVMSERRKPTILKDGFVFNFHRPGLDKIFWECSERRRNKCNARLQTSESTTNPVLILETGTHNHNPDALKTESREILSNIRTDARATLDAPSIIIARNVQQSSSATQGILPASRHIKRTIRNVRTKVQGSLCIPHRRQDINLPESFEQTVNGQKFLQFDSGPNENRILIFSTAHHLDFLKASDLWLVDGTFKSAPALFLQLFVIHGQRNNVTFPLVYCLLPNKTQATYIRMLTALKDLVPDLNPTTIMSDFERATLNAMEECFPEAERKGCFFHFAQCFHRNIQKRPDLLNLYTSDADFSLKIRHLVALAFLPPEDVVIAYQILLEDEFFEAHQLVLLDFLNYFEKTWVGPWNLRRTARLDPLFAKDLWNCFHSVLDDLPKTNNSCEGFHSGFQTILGASHPTIYKLIDGLKSQETLASLKINQFHAGKLPPTVKKYADHAKKLKTIVETYGAQDFEHVEYLRKISYCIKA